jgi:hypothetical protein
MREQQAREEERFTCDSFLISCNPHTHTHTHTHTPHWISASGIVLRIITHSVRIFLCLTILLCEGGPKLAMNSSTEPSTLHESPVRRVDAGPSLEGTPNHHHPTAAAGSRFPQYDPHLGRSLSGGGRALFSSALFADDVIDEPPPMARVTQPPLPTTSPGLTFGVPPLGPPPLHAGTALMAAGGTAVPYLNRDDLMSPMSAAAATNNSSVVYLSANRLGGVGGNAASNPPSATRLGRRASSAGHRGLRSAASTPRLGAAERAQQSFIVMKSAQVNAQRSILESASKHRLQRSLTSQALNTTARSTATGKLQAAGGGRGKRDPFAPIPASQFFAEAAASVAAAGASAAANNVNTSRGGMTKEPSFIAGGNNNSYLEHGGGGGSFYNSQHAVNPSPLLPPALQSSSTQQVASWEERPCHQCGGVIIPSYLHTGVNGAWGGRRAAPPVWSGEGAISPVTEFETMMATKLQNLGRSLRRDLK